jgi:hypothetical protein
MMPDPMSKATTHGFVYDTGVRTKDTRLCCRTQFVLVGMNGDKMRIEGHESVGMKYEVREEATGRSGRADATCYVIIGAWLGRDLAQKSCKTGQKLGSRQQDLMGESRICQPSPRVWRPSSR